MLSGANWLARGVVHDDEPSCLEDGESLTDLHRSERLTIAAQSTINSYSATLTKLRQRLPALDCATCRAMYAMSCVTFSICATKRHRNSCSRSTSSDSQPFVPAEPACSPTLPRNVTGFDIVCLRRCRYPDDMAPWLDRRVAPPETSRWHSAPPLLAGRAERVTRLSRHA
jgi:hypothetical protein